MNALVSSEQKENRLTKINPKSFPALYQANYFSSKSNGTTSIDEKTIEMLTREISSGVKEAIADGTKIGYENAVKEIIKNNLRKENLTIQKAK